MEILTVRHLSFTYPGEKEKTLREISFSLEAGSLTLLTGATGSGKSTLLRLIKRELAPRGEAGGEILFRGHPLSELSPREAGGKIGFVSQRPDQQIVTDRVWHELAFGLESLGCPEREMRRRVAETAQFFGLEALFDRGPEELSGGQKQMLNLAAATVTEPELLLLDGPTAGLDPLAARTFLAALERLRRETGMTILLAEHRLEESLSRAGSLMVMEGGTLAFAGTPAEACAHLPAGSPAEGSLPAAARIWRGSGKQGKCPLDTGEGRGWLAERLADRKEEDARSREAFRETDDHPKGESFREETDPRGGETLRKEDSGNGAGLRKGEGFEDGRDFRRTESRERKNAPRNGGLFRKNAGAAPALEMKTVWFRFGREAPDVLRSLSLRVEEGEIYALLGGNGSGKTTALRTAAGMMTPYSGEIRFFGKKLGDCSREELRRGGIALMPQDARSLFLRMTAAEELKDSGLRPEELPFDLTPLLGRHPYDLSGGEQQLLALAKAMAAKPRLLLLDEPTGGLDAAWRGRIRDTLRELKESKVSILMVTHDPEFAAETADRCGLLFRGRVEAEDAPRAFFSGGSYYVTPVSRMTRGLLPGCLTAADALAAMRAAGIRENDEKGHDAL